MTNTKPVISDAYKALNRQLHADFPDYGTQGHSGAAFIRDVCIKKGYRSVLDYGCGKGTLKKQLAEIMPELMVLEFDPAIEGKDVLPTQPIHMLAAIDVMEHIEPDYLTDVLRTMHGLKPDMVFLGISTHPANKFLADGRNAHLIVQPVEWWLEQLAPFFKTLQATTHEKTGHVVYRGAPI